MKKFTSFQQVFYGLVFFVFSQLTSAQSQGFSPEAQNGLQQVLQNFQNNPSFVGGISAAIKVDGLASWQGATGFAARNVDAQNNLLPGGSAFTNSTLSRIYSVTKTFTAALVLELAREGALHLNNTVSSYLPLSLINANLNPSVTIRQLLVHESGYSDYTGEMQLLLAVAFQPTHVWTPFEVIYFVHQESQPGSVRKYSSTNYIMLGAIVEAATGKNIEQHFRERFFDPLSLNSMYFGVREPQPSGTLLASPHDNISAFNPVFQLTGQSTFPNAYTNISRFPYDGIASSAFTSGGVISNASDVAEWGNALFNGRATSEATLDSMINSISSIPDAQGDYLGYGIWASTKMSSTETFLGHDGNAPGYRSVMFYQPDKKLTLVVLTNFNGADIYAIARSLYAAVPKFICGNDKRKENKIKLCFNGNTLCVDRNAANGFINKGAYLGTCEIESAASINKKVITTQVENFTVSPNPFSNKVKLLFKANVDGPISLSIFDMTGRLMSTTHGGTVQKGSIRQMDIATQQLPAGVYVFNLKTASGVLQKKLVLSR